jgi:hypothetical protein
MLRLLPRAGASAAQNASRIAGRCFLGAGGLQLSCAVVLHRCYGCLSDILPHYAREGEVAIGARELLQQSRLALYHRVFYNITPELAGSGAVGAPVGEAGKTGICAIAAL